MRNATVSTIVGALLVSGCYEGVDGVGGVRERGLQVNGISFNGISFNGISFNGVSLNGISLNGISLNGVSLNGISLNGVSLNGLSLNGIGLNGLGLNGLGLNGLSLNGSELTTELVTGEGSSVVGGTDIIGLTFDLTAVVDGQEVPLEMKIEDMYPDVDSGWDDIYLYELRVRAQGGDEWINPCVDAGGVGVPAIALQNHWDPATGDRIDDPDVISFSCTTGVLAHCTLWGYRPWAEAEICDGKGKKKWKHCETVSLQDHHQACTRMARADYCGDGTPWTVPGTQIDIWDDLSPQIQARAVHGKIEAEWSPDGAYCLSDIRQQGWKEEGLYPQCGKAFDKHNKKIKDCGSLKKHRALMVSSFDPNAS